MRMTFPGGILIPCRPSPFGSTRKSRNAAYFSLMLKYLRTCDESPLRSVDHFPGALDMHPLVGLGADLAADAPCSAPVIAVHGITW